MQFGYYEEHTRVDQSVQMSLERVPTSRKVFSLSIRLVFFSINLCLCSAKRPWCAGIWRWGAPTRVRAFYYCGFPCFHIVSWRHPFSYKTLSLCTSFCKHLLFKKKGYCSPKEKNRLYSISRRIDQNLRTFFWDVAPFKSLTVYVHNSTPTSRSSYRLLDDFDVCKLKEKRKYFFKKKNTWR